MNYRHIFHAGNFADVVKHIALVLALEHLRRKDTPFAVIDSHAGRGLYDLSSADARRTGEAANGIDRLRDPVSEAGAPAGLLRYLALVDQGGPGVYPGSPLIAARLLRPQDRLIAIEKQPQEAMLLRTALAPFARARVVAGDGYGRLPALLPPPERRGLVLIDPPFEAPDEFETAAGAVRGALRRFATGIYLVWYPVKSAAAARAFCDEVLMSDAGPASGVRALAIETAIDAPAGKLARAGLLVLNPPFGFDREMRAILAVIAPRLPGGAARLDWLRGADTPGS